MCVFPLNWFKSLTTKEEGVTAIEYGLIAALICVVIIVALFSVGAAVETTFNTWTNAVSNAIQSS